MPLRTTARITAFRPGQSPPPVSIPMRMRPPRYQFRPILRRAPAQRTDAEVGRPPRTMDNEEPEPEAATEPSPVSPGEPPARPMTRTERRLRKLTGRKSPYEGPIVAIARAW